MKEKRRIKKTKTEKNKGDKSYSERVTARWFCCASKLGFLQLICKASLIFKSYLELALSIILKESECRCLKTWNLLFFLICSSVLDLKWQQASPI